MPEELVWKDRAERLWQLLDDIDTLGDSMKPEQTPYFKAVDRISGKRHEILKSLDGYTLTGVEGLVKKIAKKKARYEKVHNPKHYNAHPSGVEAIEIIEHMTFNSGTAVKYLWRAGLKPGEETLEDLKKALWYVGREIKKVTKELELAPKKPRKRR